MKRVHFLAAALIGVAAFVPLSCKARGGTPRGAERQPVAAAAAAPVAAPAAPAAAIAGRPDGLKLPVPRPFTPPQPTRQVLANGLTVFLLEDHELPLIRLKGMVRAASVFEPADKVGLAEICGSVMRSGGTKAHPADRLDLELDQKAISLGVEIGEGAGSISLGCLAETFDAALPILVDVLLEPAFPEDKLELAKSHAKSAIARRNDEADDIAGREFAKVIYGPDNPWARTSELATIDRIRRADLVEFHRTWFHPDYTVLGVSGDFKTDEMLRKLEAAFAGWKKSGAAPPPAPDVAGARAEAAGVYLVRKEDVNQSTILIGHLGVKRDVPDYAALVLLDSILGSGGFSSRLFNHIREQRGLAYDVHSNLGAGFDHPGKFEIGAQTKSQSTAAVIRAALDEMRAIQEQPVTAAELAQAKESFLNSSVFYYDDKAEVLARHLRYEYYGTPHDFLESLLERIKTVSVADVQGAARKYLHPDRATILVVGKEADFDAPLSTFGVVKEIALAAPAAAGGGPREMAADTPETRARAAAIVQAALAAHGGREAVAAVKDMKLKTQLLVPTPQGDMPLGGSVSLRFPDRFKMVMQSPIGAMTQVYDGTAGWVQTPQGVKELKGGELEEVRQTLAGHWMPLLLALADGKVAAYFFRSEELNGRPVDVLLLPAAQGEPSLLSFDAETHRVVRQARPAGGAVITEVYEDFKEVDKVIFPHRWVTTEPSGDKGMEVKVTEAKFNVGLADKDFARPAAKEKKPPKEKEPKGRPAGEEKKGEEKETGGKKGEQGAEGEEKGGK